MQGSGEMHSEDDKALSDKNKKRTLKTRAQTEALEKFYDEHKYPTESMKAELAGRIGLTEKQVSSWFCHRRLKDKRNGEVYANGRQDRSSGVIQDLGSGLRQDSCGSTKQGDDKYQDPIEVQSRIFNGQELKAANLIYEHGSQYAGNWGRMDDTSSGSSYSPRNICFKGDPMRMATSKFSTQSVANNVKGGKPRCGPSGYLKVKGRVENSAITAVKRQLGTDYREDGPPLGIEFDPLPPGAFESSIQQPANETYFVGDNVPRHSARSFQSYQEVLSKTSHVEHNLPHSEDVSGIHKQPMSSTGYGYPSSRSLHKTVLDGKKVKSIHGSDHSESFSSQKPKQDFSLLKHSSMDLHEGSAQDIEFHDRRNNYEMRADGGPGGFRKRGLVGHNQFQPCGGEVNQEQLDHWLKSSDNRRRKGEHGDHFNSSSSDLFVKGGDDDAYEDQGFSKNVAKVDIFCGARRKTDDNLDSVRLKISQKNDMHRVKDDHPQFVGEVSRIEVPYQMNQIKRSAVEMPSSGSEDDENADTSSSGDSETET